MNDSNPNIGDLVEAAINSLIEHCDAVQIFASSQEEEHTRFVSKGRGNYFARYGQVREWIVKEEEGARVEIRKASEE